MSEISRAVSSGTRLARQVPKGFLAFFASNTVSANLLMAFFLIGGLFAGMQLTSQVFPTIDPRMISITVSYPGANPFEVEDSITRRIEESLVGLDGVDRVVSTASENMGSIVVELKDFVDAD